MEISQAIARFICEAPNKEEKRTYVSTAYFFSLTMYSLFSAIIYLFYTEIAGWLFKAEEPAYLVLYIIPWLFLHGTFTFITNQFRWENKPKEQVFLQSINGIFLLLCVSIFLLYLPPSIEGLLHSYLLSLFFSVLIGFVLVFRHRIMGILFSTDKLRIMLLFSIPLVPSSLCVFAQNYTDRLMVNQIIDIEAVGLYSLAFKVASLLTLISGIFQLSIVPLIYKHYEDKDSSKDFGNIAKIYLFFILSTIIGVSVFAPELFYLFIGEEFYNAVGLVPLLLIAIGFQSFYIFAPGLAIAKKTQYIALINIGGMIINVILNYLFISQWGLYGAAGATIISAILICIVNIIVSQKYYFISYDYLKICLSIFVTVIFIYGFYSVAVEFIWVDFFVKIASITIICLFLVYFLAFDTLKKLRL